MRAEGCLPEPTARVGQGNLKGEKKMSKNTCQGDHEGHLCVLVSQEKFEEVKELVKDPGYICFNCGRAADSDKNLCNPMPLD